MFQIGTGITNLLINVRKAVDKSFSREAEDIPMLATSIAYGVYLSVSANLRYVYILQRTLLQELTSRITNTLTHLFIIGTN